MNQRAWEREQTRWKRESVIEDGNLEMTQVEEERELRVLKQKMKELYENCLTPLERAI